MQSQSNGDGTQPKLRVLLIDDDPLVGVAFSRLLNPFNVTFAQSAVGGLARVQAGGKFDAIVCDMYMPGMNGMQFYDEVAMVSQRLARQIIFVTGSASAPEAAAFLERTSNICLAKPVKREALKSAVVAASKVMRP